MEWLDNLRRELLNERVRGAGWYARRVAEEICKNWRSIEGVSKLENIREVLLDVAPHMSSVRNVLELALEAFSLGGQHGLKNAMEAFLRYQRLCIARIRENFRALLSRLGTESVVTISYSYLMLQSILGSRDLVKIVYVLESAPGCEGRVMYEQVKEHGINVRLVEDMRVGSIIRIHRPLAMSGADAVLESGDVVNKVGTSVLASVARAFNSPYVVLVESYKYGSPKELPDESSMFDVTPRKLVTAYVTECGVLQDPEQVRECWERSRREVLGCAVK